MRQLEKIELHPYTKTEDAINWVSHLLGVFFAVTALVFGIMAAANVSAIAIVAMVIYGVTLILQYVNSTVYHVLPQNNAKRFFRVMDHCSIFVLMAGTYAPYTLITLGDMWLGYVLFAFAWIVAGIGVTLKSIDLKKYRKFADICYAFLALGILAAVVPLIERIAPWGVFLMLIGSGCLIAGIMFYGFGKKTRYLHSIWHLFVLAGTIVQYLAILFYVL
ncbi:MAG: hemolysin III family protein [Firmicutes bacterium]|nr:hemolysin III family protein [Bacillota bacterium]